MTDLERIADLSMRFGGSYMADFGAPKSRHDFTQYQLMSCLILKAYLKTTYRGVLDILASSESLRQALLLDRKLPHYTTLQKFNARSDVMQIAAEIMRRIGKELTQRGGSDAVALDATGLESCVASAHFVARSGHTRSRWVKVSVSVVCGVLLPLAMVVDWGPTNDKVQARALLEQTWANANPQVLYADAGYDAEWIHQWVHSHQSQSIINPVLHRKDGTLGGQLRSGMTSERLKQARYGRRWNVECFFSALKRKVGSTLSSRKDDMLLKEAIWKVLAYTLHR